MCNASVSGVGRMRKCARGEGGEFRGAKSNERANPTLSMECGVGIREMKSEKVGRERREGPPISNEVRESVQVGPPPFRTLMMTNDMRRRVNTTSGRRGAKHAGMHQGQRDGERNPRERLRGAFPVPSALFSSRDGPNALWLPSSSSRSCSDILDSPAIQATSLDIQASCIASSGPDLDGFRRDTRPRARKRGME